MHFHRDVLAMRDVLAAHAAASRARRHLHRQPAARLHFRPGRLLLFPMRVGAATLPGRAADARRSCSTPSRAIARRCCSRRRRRIARWRRCVAGARHFARCASASPRAKRCRRRPASCGRTRRASRSSTASARPRCCTSSFRTTKRMRRPGATGKPVPGYQACVIDDEGSPLPRRTASAVWRSRDRPAAAISPTRASANTCRTAGTSPATPTYVDEDGYFVFQARTDDMIISRRLQHRRPGSRERAAAASGRARMRAWSACRTSSAARSSRRSSC